MYIITYEELDQHNQSWSEQGRTFNGADFAEDFLKYMLENEHYGLVRNIKVWNAQEIPYKSDVKFEIDFKIDWEG